MFRFTIRDVLWLMVVVGMAVSLYLERVSRRRLTADYQRMASEREIFRANAEQLDKKLGRQLETIIKQDRELDRVKALTRQ